MNESFEQRAGASPTCTRVTWGRGLRLLLQDRQREACSKGLNLLRDQIAVGYLQTPTSSALCAGLWLPLATVAREGGRKPFMDGDGAAPGLPALPTSLCSHPPGKAISMSWVLPFTQEIFVSSDQSFAQAPGAPHAVCWPLGRGWCSPAAQPPALSPHKACTEVYTFSKAFDNVKLGGRRVLSTHSDVIFVYVCNI